MQLVGGSGADEARDRPEPDPVCLRASWLQSVGSGSNSGCAAARLGDTMAVTRRLSLRCLVTMRVTVHSSRTTKQTKLNSASYGSANLRATAILTSCQK